MKKVIYLLIFTCLILPLSACEKGMAEAVGNGSKNIQTNTQFLKCNMEIDDGIPETEAGTWGAICCDAVVL